MNEDATKDGVSQDEDLSQVSTIADDRTSLLDSIVNENDEIRQKDEDDVGIELDDIEDDDQDDIEDSDDPAGEDDIETNEEDEEKLEIIVDGEKQKVPLSKILDAGKRTLQKETAADKRLEEATKLLKEVKEGKPSEKDADDQDDAPKRLTPKEIAHAIQYGDEDEAAAAIEQLNTIGQSKDTLTPDKVKEIAAETVKETTNTNEIVIKFNQPKDKGGFGDLSEDPYLMKMAIDIVNQKLEKGEKNSWKTYESAGKEVREWVGKFKPQAKESSFESKKEKKKNIDNVKAASAVKDIQKPKDKGQTASDVIDELAQTRPGR